MADKAYKAKCYTTHPELTIETKNGSVDFVGGSCLSPIDAMADIYIGFERGMLLHPRRLPWIPGESFVFPITNMKAPDDPTEFHTMLTWVWRQAAWGQRVHVGCIGGHGRTGLFLAAMVAWVTHNPKAIQYVRKNYCERAVETKEQIDFLAKHYECDTDGVKAIYKYPAKKTKEQIELDWAGGADE